MHSAPGPIVVLGATGRTGLPLVRKLLDSGYRVRAQVRDPAKLTFAHERLEVATGDALDAEFADVLLAGASAAISVVGQVDGSPPDVQTRITHNLLAAARRHGVTRIVSLTGAGVAHERDTPRVIDRLVRWVMRTFFGKLLRDAEAHARLLRDSDLAYTIVRAPRLTEDTARGTYRTGYVGQVGTSLTRADLAAFIVDELLTGGGHLRDEPAVSN